MTKKPAYKFIQYPYECSLGSSPDVLIEHTILDKDCSLSDLLQVMEGFLKASGHYFTGRLDIVDEEDESPKAGMEPSDLPAYWTGPYYSSDPNFLEAVGKSQEGSDTLNIDFDSVRHEVKASYQLDAGLIPKDNKQTGE